MKGYTMGAKQSAEMIEAKRLVLVEKLTAYAAAKQAGISQGAISKSKWYRDHKDKPDATTKGSNK